MDMLPLAKRPPNFAEPEVPADEFVDDSLSLVYMELIFTFNSISVDETRMKGIGTIVRIGTCNTIS